MYSFSSLPSEIDKFSKAGIIQHLPYINRGLEKEALRQSPEGKLSQKPHPHGLGSALTNQYITTDYSEALLEFITPVFKDKANLLDFLKNLHSFALMHMDKNETLWCHSMPCILTREEDIPIAEYGSSNIGMMKHIYRRGLDWRYTRRMQTIAGIHFNFSYPDELWQFLHHQSGANLNLQEYKSNGYFKLIRNFQRYAWLLFYFTGSSPALCKSFLTGQEHNLDSFDECTAYLPYATSLRMSDLGYTNKEQQSLNISFNSLQEYVNGLTKAIKTPSTEFEKIGTQVNGEYRQLNSNILQIENEFYSIIRPKRTAHSGEMPSMALRRRGVEYIEIRMLDINPFEPTGISSDQVDFLDIFMLSCLLEQSPQISDKEWQCIQNNQQKAILEARNPDLMLDTCQSEPLSFRQAAEQSLNNFQATAKLLDEAFKTNNYSQVLDKYKEMLQKPELTPSGRVIEEMKKGECSYYPFAKDISFQHNNYFKNSQIPQELLEHFTERAQTSHRLQKEIEQNDSISFEVFLANYFSQ